MTNNMYFVRDDELVPEKETKRTNNLLGEGSVISDGQICS